MSKVGGKRDSRKRFRYRYAKRPGAILRSARRTLGLSPAAVLAVLEQHERPLSIAQYRRIELDRTGDHIGACDWWMLCQVFSISCDSFSYGYCEREHLMRVRGSLADGKFLLPVSAKLTCRLDALAETEQRERELDELQWTTGLVFHLPKNHLRSEWLEV